MTGQPSKKNSRTKMPPANYNSPLKTSCKYPSSGTVIPILKSGIGTGSQLQVSRQTLQSQVVAVQKRRSSELEDEESLRSEAITESSLASLDSFILRDSSACLVLCVEEEEDELSACIDGKRTKAIKQRAI